MPSKKFKKSEKAAPKKAVKKSTSKKAAKKSVPKKKAKKATPDKSEKISKKAFPPSALPPTRTLTCICRKKGDEWFCMKLKPDGRFKKCDGPFDSEEECKTHAVCD